MVMSEIEREKARVRSREWRKNNPERSRAGAKRWAAANPDKVLASNIKKYGLSLDEFRVLEERANGGCMICASNPRGLSNAKRLHVDHDHSTGEVRGLLCGACNVGLGHFNDDVKLLRKAMIYLGENGDV